MKKITSTFAILIFCITSLNVFGQQTFLFDLNHNNSELNVSVGNWNNHLGSSVNAANDIIDFINDQGVASTYSFGVSDDFVAANDNGASSTNSDFPNTATKDSYYVQNGGNETGAFTLSGLNTSLYYHFEIIASRNGVSDNRESQYTATGLTSDVALLDAANNSGTTVTINNIQPDASGNIVLALQKGAGNTNGSGFSYLGAFILTETDAPLSLDDLELKSNFTLYPNPSTDKFSVSIKMNQEANVAIAMYDVNGKMVTSIYNDNVSAGVFEYTWNRTSEHTDKIAAGLYILEVNANGRKMTKKVILK